MKSWDVTLVQNGETALYGLWASSCGRTAAKDIPRLSKQYYGKVQKEPGSVLPFFVLSRNYDEQSRKFELFIGSTAVDKELDVFILPAGTYGRITVRPKFGMFWGAAIGAAKTFFYTRWLSENGYRAVNLEYEYHTEKSLGKSPTIDILFAVQE